MRRSRSSLIVLAALSAGACAKGGNDGREPDTGRGPPEIALVRSEQYGSRACWIDREGAFAAFLVLAREDRVAVPYLVSAKCLVAGYTSYGEATLHHLNTIRLDDSFDTLQRALPGLAISGNVITDLPTPSSDSRIYYFRARLARAPDRYRTVYAPRNIIELRAMDMSFERFLGLSREEREGLLRQLDPGY